MRTIGLIFLLLACETKKSQEPLPVPEPAPEPSEETDSAEDTDVDTGVDTDEDTGTDTDTGDEIETGETGEIPDTSDTGEFEIPEDALSDFSLPDINTASATYQQIISPRDYIQQVTGWYFIKAT